MSLEDGLNDSEADGTVYVFEVIGNELRNLDVLCDCTQISLSSVQNLKYNSLINLYKKFFLSINVKLLMIDIHYQ